MQKEPTRDIQQETVEENKLRGDVLGEIKRRKDYGKYGNKNISSKSLLELYVKNVN